MPPAWRTDIKIVFNWIESVRQSFRNNFHFTVKTAVNFQIRFKFHNVGWNCRSVINGCEHGSEFWTGRNYKRTVVYTFTPHLEAVARMQGMWRFIPVLCCRVDIVWIKPHCIGVYSGIFRRTGMNVQQGTLTTVIARFPWFILYNRVKEVNGKVPVSLAVPSPVEMEQPFAIIAVANERMGGWNRKASVQYRAIILQGIVEQLRPATKREPATANISDIVAVIPIFQQSLSGIVDIGTGSRREIVHTHTSPQTTQQMGHGLSLLFGSGRCGVVTEHIFPVKRILREIGMDICPYFFGTVCQLSFTL